MTNQPTNNEWIEKARLQFRDNWKWNQTSEDFRKAIEDNFPKSISREAVEKLRNQRQREIKKYNADKFRDDGWAYYNNIWK